MSPDFERELAENGIVVPVIVNGWQIYGDGYFDPPMDRGFRLEFVRTPEPLVLWKFGRFYAMDAHSKWIENIYTGVKRDTRIQVGTFRNEPDKMKAAYDGLVKWCGEQEPGVFTVADVEP